MNSLANMCETNEVTLAANKLICQAADRVFRVTRGKRVCKSSGPKWYDAECRSMRSIAVKAGERVHNQADRDNLSEKCRQYRACKQMKKRKIPQWNNWRNWGCLPHKLTKSLENNWPSLPPAFTLKWTYGAGISRLFQRIVDAPVPRLFWLFARKWCCVFLKRTRHVNW